MPDIFHVQIFDCPFVIIRDEVDFYVKVKDLFDFLKIRRINEKDLTFKKFKDFDMKYNKVNWRSNFLNFESARRVIEMAKCSSTRKEILWGGLRLCISRILSVLNPSKEVPSFDSPSTSQNSIPWIEPDDTTSKFGNEPSSKPSTSKDMSNFKDILCELQIKNAALLKQLAEYTNPQM